MSDGPIGNDSNTADLVKALEQRAKRLKRESQPDKPASKTSSHLRAGGPDDIEHDALKRRRIDDEFQALLRASHSTLEGKKPTIQSTDVPHHFPRHFTIRRTDFM